MSRPSVSWSARYCLDLLEQLGVVGPVGVEPEHGRGAGGPGPGHGELHPVLHRDVLHRAHPPDVAGVDLVAEQHGAVGADDLDGAGPGDLEGLVVAAVLLGGLRHQPDVGHRAHRRRVVGAVGPAVVDDGLVDAGVGRVGDDRLGSPAPRPRRSTCGPSCGSWPASRRRRSRPTARAGWRSPGRSRPWRPPARPPTPPRCRPRSRPAGPPAAWRPRRGRRPSRCWGCRRRRRWRRRAWRTRRRRTPSRRGRRGSGRRPSSSWP